MGRCHYCHPISILYVRSTNANADHSRDSHSLQNEYHGNRNMLPQRYLLIRAYSLPGTVPIVSRACLAITKFATLPGKGSMAVMEMTGLRRTFTSCCYRRPTVFFFKCISTKHEVEARSNTATRVTRRARRECPCTVLLHCSSVVDSACMHA